MARPAAILLSRTSRGLLLSMYVLEAMTSADKKNNRLVSDVQQMLHSWAQKNQDLQHGLDSKSELGRHNKCALGCSKSYSRFKIKLSIAAPLNQALLIHRLPSSSARMSLSKAAAWQYPAEGWVAYLEW